MTAPQNTLRQRDFIIVLAGQIISLFGNAILRFALPLYLLRETGSAALYGGVSALSFLPMIALSLVGGVLADRVNKRNVMVALDFGVALLCALFLLWMDRFSAAAATGGLPDAALRRFRGLSARGAGQHACALARRSLAARQCRRQYGRHAGRSGRSGDWGRAVWPVGIAARFWRSAPPVLRPRRRWNCFCASPTKSSLARGAFSPRPAWTLRKAGASCAGTGPRCCR